MITKQDVQSWVKDPVTREFMRLMQEAKEETQRIILEGEFLRMSDVDKEYIYHMGILEGITKIQNAEIINDEEEIDQERSR